MDAILPGPATNSIAMRESWKTLDPPETRTELDFTESYNRSDFERIKRGLVPEEMEDKWFIFFEEPWLYFHKSWTGIGVYGVEFRPSLHGALVAASWIGGDHHIEPDRNYHRAMLNFLIDALLLRRPANFPIPDDFPHGVPKDLYQHHVAGAAYPQATFPASQYAHGQSWARFLRRFRRVKTPIS